MNTTFYLPHGYETVVDEEDSDLSEFYWRVTPPVPAKGKKQYVVRSTGKCNPRLSLHRVITERIIKRSLTAGEVVDHIDGNPLNNRRSNLRIATIAENSANCKKSVRNTSGFKGVTLHKKSGKWQSCIKSGGKSHYLGLFNNPEEAFTAYKQAAIRLHGEFARFE